MFVSGVIITIILMVVSLYAFSVIEGILTDGRSPITSTFNQQFNLMRKFISTSQRTKRQELAGKYVNTENPKSFIDLKANGTFQAENRMGMDFVSVTFWWVEEENGRTIVYLPYNKIMSKQGQLEWIAFRLENDVLIYLEDTEPEFDYFDDTDRYAKE